MATKINDGLFIGDAEASQDPEFIELNKITFVINCAGRQLPNLWEQHGLHYLTFPWTSDPDCTLFDGGNVVIEQITNFIDEAGEKGDSVLVHSLDGRGRCIACVSAYLMFRYRWSFEKALDFLCNKRPDAAPNPGFVQQQLYRLDLRLYERWYGQSKKPTEDERIRHDQWIPLVPGHVPGREKASQRRNQGFKAAAGGQQPQFLAPSAGSREKDGIATVIADAAAGCFGGAASAFPSLGQLTEVQEEEIVLVNSFLNSQPQIDALPPGRADYDDHVPKELHWIDRPRVDKLTAAGRLGRTKDRRQHMIPVSPRTGHATPERPGNSSYHALSRGNKAATPTTAVPVGILKKAGTTELNLMGGRGQTNPRSTQPEGREVGVLPSGDTPAAVSGVEGAGGAALAPIPSSPSSSTRTVGRAEADKEVVVEDLSDRWSRGDGGTAGSGLSEHETASSGGLSSAGHAQQGPGGHLLEDGMENSCAAEGDDETDTISTAGNEPGRPEQHRSAKVSSSTPQDDFSTSGYAAPPADRTTKHDHQGVSLERGVREGRGPAAAGRKEERQAWDGSSGGGGGADSAGVKKTGGDHGRGRVDGSRGKTEPNLLETTARYIEKAKASTTRATSNMPSTNRHAGTKIDVDKKALAAATIEPPAAALAHTKNQLRRGGSEGSLQSTISGNRSTGTTANPAAQQDNIRLPQAPVGRAAAKHGKTPFDDSPGPGWGPDDIRRDGLGSGRQRMRAESGGDSPAASAAAGDEAYRQGPGRWENKGSRLYPGATDVGGGTLQQLAQAPNPQQRRLPSPRPQQDLGQGDRRQNSSDAGPIFPQKRPNSAPLQRPDGSESDSKSTGPGDAAEEERTRDGGGSSAVNSAPSFREGPPRAPASSSVGAANQGYPAHGLMPSGSMVQINTTAGDRGGRVGAAAYSAGAGGSSSIRPSPQAHGLSAGSSGGSQREAPATSRNGGGGRGGGAGREGGAYSSMEQSRLGLKSSGEGIDAEQRGAKTHQSGYRGSNIGSLPRDIRTSQTIEDSSRVRGGVGSPAPLPTDRAVGVGSLNTDHTRPHGSQRASSGMAPASRAKTTGILPPKAGTLPLPSRRAGSTSSDGRDGDGGGGGGSDDLRWANPAPRGRQGHAKGSSGAYGYPGSTENRGGGNQVPSRISRHSADSYGQMPHDGGGQQRSSSRAGGAPIYRSGSPAPVRGRKTANNAAGAAKSADPSRFLYQQRARGSEHTPSRIPPSFRGYMASSGSGSGSGVADSGRRGTTARRSHVPSPKTRDRGQRASGSDTIGRYPVQTSSATGVPRASLVADRSPGQRPSTSEGLTGGNGAGRRGRSASPAPRPSSASGRRRSASPSPASLFTSKIDPSFDRPRWK
ncbi:unnamed protein product [Ectocarpus fasciculatus]